MSEMATVILSYSVTINTVLDRWTDEERAAFHDGDAEARGEFEDQAYELCRRDLASAPDIEVILP